MRKTTFLLAAAALLFCRLQAQICDPSLAPAGLISTYTPGSGALLQWDAVPGSVGVQLRVDLPSGSSISRRLVGPEVDQFFAPDVLLSPGTYSWRVQAACSTIPPFDATPISGSSIFEVGGSSSCPASVADIDGNTYSTAAVGDQCWMAGNYKAERYRNGDAIPTGLSNIDWLSATEGAFAVYNNLEANKAIYGLIYNWFAVADPRGLCPSGWRVAQNDDWWLLVVALGGQATAGGAMKATGTLSAGTGLWQAPNTAATNSSGFSGLPAGQRSLTGSFGGLGNVGYWWTASETPVGLAWVWELTAASGGAFNFDVSKENGFAVRCIKE